MLNRLPEFIDPVQLADKRGALQGELPIHGLTRLADLLFDESGVIAMELFFARQGRLAIIEGRLEATLQLKCQSCLQAVPYNMNSVVKLGIVSSLEQADRLPEDYEPLLVEAEKIPLKDLLEDELLLLLPSYPKHDDDCFHATTESAAIITVAHKPAATHPFSILATLNTSENSNGRTKK